MVIKHQWGGLNTFSICPLFPAGALTVFSQCFQSRLNNMLRGHSTNNSAGLPQQTCGGWIHSRSIEFPEPSPKVSTTDVQLQLFVTQYIVLAFSNFFSHIHIPCLLCSPETQQIALQSWQYTENVDRSSRSVNMLLLVSSFLLPSFCICTALSSHFSVCGSPWLTIRNDQHCKKNLCLS